MLVFQPDLSATLPGPASRNEVVICLDCSNSMEGVTFIQAKQIALYALSLVGEEQRVNVVQFGTGEHALSPAHAYVFLKLMHMPCGMMTVGAKLCVVGSSQA